MSNSLPAAGGITAVADEGAAKTAFENQRDFISSLLGGAAESELTISSGVVTPPTRNGGGNYTVDTESDAASDDLNTIAQTNLQPGQFIFLRLENSARNVVFKHAAGGAGQLSMAGGVDFTMTTTTQSIMFMYMSNTNWMEVDRNWTGAAESFLTGIVLKAAEKIWFDGSSDVGGDTYMFESSANVLDTYTAGNLAQKIDAVGIITHPLQCCFQSTATTQNNVTGDSTDYTITFATTVIDRNADFSSPTFTAPVTGQYVLSATVNLEGLTAAADYSKMSFVTSNRTYEIIWQDTNDMPQPAFNFTILCDMDAADTAIVKILVAGEAGVVVDLATSSERTHFSGYLLG